MARPPCQAGGQRRRSERKDIFRYASPVAREVNPNAPVSEINTLGLRIEQIFKEENIRTQRCEWRERLVVAEHSLVTGHGHATREVENHQAQGRRLSLR